MDIVVTVPKREITRVNRENVWAQEHTAKGQVIHQGWSMKRLPKSCFPDDRVYFIHDGVIVNYNVLIGTDYDFHCEYSDRTWPGPCLILYYPCVPLKNPVPMKGFQGFRYIERIE